VRFSSITRKLVISILISFLFISLVPNIPYFPKVFHANASGPVVQYCTNTARGIDASASCTLPSGTTSGDYIVANAYSPYGVDGVTDSCGGSMTQLVSFNQYWYLLDSSGGSCGASTLSSYSCASNSNCVVTLVLYELTEISPITEYSASGTVGSSCSSPPCTYTATFSTGGAFVDSNFFVNANSAPSSCLTSYGTTILSNTNNGDMCTAYSTNVGSGSVTWSSTCNNPSCATLWTIYGVQIGYATETITFSQSGISNEPLGNQILQINNTLYDLSALPLSFNYGTGTSVNFNYGYFSSYGPFNFQSLSGCGQTSKDGIFAISSSCTITAIYSNNGQQSGDANQSRIIQVVNNEMTGVVVFLIPSLIILLLFLYVSKSLLHFSGDMLLVSMMIGIAVLMIVGIIVSGSFVPAWIGGITEIFLIGGFFYEKKH
jgi:hypothetical protein